MTPIDLEALHLALGVLDYEIRTIPSDSQSYGPQREIDVADLQGARDKFAEALTELTARRARDADVEALVAAAHRAEVSFNTVRGCYERNPGNFMLAMNELESDVLPLRAALAPFTGVNP